LRRDYGIYELVSLQGEAFGSGVAAFSSTAKPRSAFLGPYRANREAGLGIELSQQKRDHFLDQTIHAATSSGA